MRFLIIFIIKIYKKIVSPILPQSCRFYPSCSVYSIKAFEKYGVIKGLWLSIRRISRCHPFNPGGYDPLP
jgi:uncharacterized protein